jgi:hypothetical protein
MSPPSRKSSVTANIGENRLVITLRGILSKKDVEALYTDIRFCVSDLKPEFNVITDMTECNFGHLSGISSLRKIVDFLLTKNVGTIVRVVGRSRIIFQQLEKLAGKREGYKEIGRASCRERVS